MRHVTFQQFQQCEPGTIFSEVHGVDPEGLSVLVGWCSDQRRDFVWADLMGHIDIGCTPFRVDGPGLDETARWGAFDDNATFLVYHRADVQRMLEVLTKAAEPPFEASDTVEHYWYEHGLWGE